MYKYEIETLTNNLYKEIRKSKKYITMQKTKQQILDDFENLIDETEYFLDKLEDFLYELNN